MATPNLKELQCEFFKSPKGCSRGARCRFAHDESKPRANAPRSAFSASKGTPPATTPQASRTPAAAPSPATPALVATPGSATGSASGAKDGKPICQYYLEGTCTRGNKCRFSHGTSAAATPAGSTVAASPAGKRPAEASESPAKKPKSEKAPKEKKVKEPKAAKQPKRKVPTPQPESSDSSSDSDSSGSSSEEEEAPMQVDPGAAKSILSIPKLAKPAKIVDTPKVAPTPKVAEVPKEKPISDKARRRAERAAAKAEAAAAAAAARAAKAKVTTPTPIPPTPPMLSSVVNGLDSTKRATEAAAGGSAAKRARAAVATPPAMLPSHAASANGTEVDFTFVGGASAAAAAAAGYRGGAGRHAVLEHLVAATAGASGYADAYAGCRWNPLPPGWVSTEGHRASLGGSAGHAVVGLDCEMVDAAPPYGKSLARFTLVKLGAAVRGNPVAERVILVDKLVSPPGRVVTDYKHAVTGFSEATFEDEDCLLSVEAAQAEILKHVSADTVVVGHALQHDLESLRIAHDRVVDTALVFISPLKHQTIGLKDTVLEVLGQECQEEGKPHISAEDAAWALELVRHVIDRVDERLPYLQRTNQIPEQGHKVTVLKAVLAALGIPESAAIKARPIAFKSAKHGGANLGSTVITCSSVEEASRIFQTLSTAGMKNDKDGLPQKKLFLNPAQFPGARHFWVKAYCSHPSITSRTAAAAAAPAMCACPQCGAVVPPKRFCCECGAPMGAA